MPPIKFDKTDLGPFPQVFDDKGNWRDGFDPFRDTGPFRELIFAKDDDPMEHGGNLKHGLHRLLANFITIKELGPFCDAVALYHAHVHGDASKGSYPAIYYWR